MRLSADEDAYIERCVGQTVASDDATPPLERDVDVVFAFDLIGFEHREEVFRVCAPGRGTAFATEQKRVPEDVSQKLERLLTAHWPPWVLRDSAFSWVWKNLPGER